ncbi:MAG TPA: penicillin-binding protein 2 [Dehalococcoidia bacterium]|nr:penicillin-binding protein 2 [Dehalococcoidia bacterium]
MDFLRGSRQRWRTENPRRGEHAFLSGQNLFLLQALILVLFGILTIQLVRMQVFELDEYQQRAENNRLRELQVLPLRGLIYDRNGAPLVQNVANYTAVITPADLPDQHPDEVFARLGEVLNIPAQEIAQKVREEDGNPYEAVVIKDELDRDTALVLKELTPNLPGVELRVEARRRYPSADLTSHIVGYVGRISEEEYASLRPRGYILNDQVGKTGIEDDYEDVLRGKPGEELAEVDASGRQLDVLDARAAQPGQSVFLTIDLELQRQAADALRAFMGSSDNATAVVMDVKSGEILAMVSLPAFDNNLFSSAISQQELDDLLNQPGKPLVNHAIAEMYAPGSTFKTITGLAALQEGVATTGTVITSKGYITVENEYDPNVVYYFRDWAALGALDFYRGVAMSSDVYFYYLAGGKADEGFRGLGEDRLAQYARAFGLGELTGVDLPGESPGIVPDARWKEQNWGEAWYVGDTYSFGIGQGYLAVTPLQLVNATAAIANGGTLLQPRLVKEIQDDHGNTLAAFGPEVRRQVPVSPDYLAVMREAMRQSVDSGVASSAKVAGLSIGGKTGTAEFGERDADGKYDTHGWFVGFAPFEDPEIAVAVFVQRGGGFQNAAPAAARIFDYYFHQRYVSEPEGSP